MMKIAQFVKSFFGDEQGTETVEWAIIIGIIAAGAITAIALIGPWVVTQFENLASSLGLM